MVTSFTIRIVNYNSYELFLESVISMLSLCGAVRHNELLQQCYEQKVVRMRATQNARNTRLASRALA